MARSVLSALAVSAALLCSTQEGRSASPVSDEALLGSQSAAPPAPANAQRTGPVLQPSALCAAGTERKGKTETVQMRFHITNEGKVDEAIVLASSGDQAFDKLAVAHAIKSWRFIAATANSRPVAVWLNGHMTYDSGAECTVPVAARPAAPPPPADEDISVLDPL